MVSSADIPPGGEGKIEVKLSTYGRSGKYERTIVVESNDPVNPRSELKMSGIVEVYASVNPSQLFLGKISKGSTRTEIVKIDAKNPEAFQVKKIISSDPNLKGEFIKSPEGPSIRVTYTAPDNKGQVYANLTIETDIPEVKSLQVSIRGEVTDDIVTNLEELYIPPSSETSRPQAELIIESLTKKPFKVKDAKPSNNLIDIQTRQIEKGWQVIASPKKGVTSGDGKLIIKTDRKGQETIEIPFRITNEKQFIRPVAPFTRSEIRPPATLRGLRR